MRRRTFAAVVATIAVAQLLVAAPVTARPPTTDGLEQDTNVAVEAETLTLDLDMATPQSVDGPVVFTATLSVDPGGGQIMYTIDSYEPMYEPVGPGGVTTVNLSGLTAGQHRVHVRFTGYGPYAATDVAIADFLLQRSSATSLSVNRTTAFVGEMPVVLTASVSTTDGDWAVTSVTLLDDVAGDVVEIGPLDLEPTTRTVTYSSNDLRIGVHSIRARYNAPSSTSPSVSGPVTVTVQADTAVHATFTRSMTTVYPYKDGVKDTGAVRRRPRGRGDSHRPHLQQRRVAQADLDPRDEARRVVRRDVGRQDVGRDEARRREVQGGRVLRGHAGPREDGDDLRQPQLARGDVEDGDGDHEVRRPVRLLRGPDGGPPLPQPRSQPWADHGRRPEAELHHLPVHLRGQDVPADDQRRRVPVDLRDDVRPRLQRS